VNGAHLRGFAPRTNSTEEQSLKFSIKVVNKAAASATQFTKYIMLHAYLRTIASSQLRENKQKLHTAYFIELAIKVFRVIN